MKNFKKTTKLQNLVNKRDGAQFALDNLEKSESKRERENSFAGYYKIAFDRMFNEFNIEDIKLLKAKRKNARYNVDKAFTSDLNESIKITEELIEEIREEAKAEAAKKVASYKSQGEDLKKDYLEEAKALEDEIYELNLRIEGIRAAA